MAACCRIQPPSRSQLPISPNQMLPARHSFVVISNPRVRDFSAYSINSENRISSSVTPSASTSASSIVREFYDKINRREVASVGPLIAEDCVYEDMVFASPFVGRKAIVEFFKKFTDFLSQDLQFVIDDISGDDSSAIGLTWHLEWRGKTFPFSRGCSFYRLKMIDGRKQIVYGRDCVESALKPGEISLVVIRAVASLLQRFPQLIDQFR